jgi:hypothetical protein
MPTLPACLRPVRQPEASQGHPGEADAEFFERLTPRCCQGQSLGQFVKLVIHTFPFVLLFVVLFNLGFHG